MKTSKHSEATEELVKEFQEVLEERDRLSVELVRLVAAVRAIAGLPGNEGFEANWVRDMEEQIWNPRPSLRVGVRMALELTGRLMTPPEIKDELNSHGYDLRKYSFSIGAIHEALRVLVREGSVMQRLDPLGRKAYQWKGYIRSV
jgi:hypothetical protein